MLAGVSTRRFARTREPVGQDVLERERSASKSAVSREFVGRTGEHLRALMSRSLADVRLAALMLDGLDLKGRCCVVALGVTTDGVKLPLGLWDGSTENATVARTLLADLVERGLDCEQGVLVVLDGGKALRAAVGQVLGDVPVQRCVRHKERNVLNHLPERDRPGVKRRLEADQPRGRARAPGDAGQRARALPSRRRGVASRGHGGHARAKVGTDLPGASSRQVILRRGDSLEVRDELGIHEDRVCGFAQHSGERLAHGAKYERPIQTLLNKVVGALELRIVNDDALERRRHATIVARHRS